MLSRLLISAKNLFTQPQSTGNNNQNEKSNSGSEEMVTTRQTGKSARDGASADDPIIVQTPGTSRKRQRKSEGGSLLEATNASSKEGKDLPVRAKGDEIPNSNTRVVVEIPVSKSPLGIKGESSTGKSLKTREIIEIEDSAESNVDQDEVEEELDEHSRVDGLEPVTSKVEKPSTNAGNEGRLGEDVNAAMSAPKPKHKRFGSEELEEGFFSTAIEMMGFEDESSDDDDAPPEVVETQVAQKAVESRARDAARAIEEQESAIRQKRVERDAVLKKQAAEATNKKRKHRDQDEEAAHSKKLKTSEDIDPPRSTKRAPLPDLLPAEYLEDKEEGLDTASIPESEISIPKTKKTKFTDIQKKPKDRRKGSTIYRVSEVRSTNLAPKASPAARSSKNQLYRRSGKKLTSTRKSFLVGFSTKR